MNEDELADIIKRMMRDLQEDDDNPNKAPRCDGCGQRVELAPYQGRMTDGGTEALYFCADCRALAMIERLEDSDLWGYCCQVGLFFSLGSNRRGRACATALRAAHHPQRSSVSSPFPVIDCDALSFSRKCCSVSACLSRERAPSLDYSRR
jgi:hypothetical protein